MHLMQWAMSNGLFWLFGLQILHGVCGPRMELFGVGAGWPDVTAASDGLFFASGPVRG